MLSKNRLQKLERAAGLEPGAERSAFRLAVHFLSMSYQVNGLTLRYQGLLRWKRENLAGFNSWVRCWPPEEWTKEDQAEYRAALRLKGKPEKVAAFVKRIKFRIDLDVKEHPAVIRKVQDAFDKTKDRREAAHARREYALYNQRAAGEIDQATLFSGLLALHHEATA